MGRPSGFPPAKLIGRHTEAEAFRQLRESGARVITVLGPPGIGKTAFVRAVMEDSWPFIPLEGVTDAAELGRRVAAALGSAEALAERSGRDAVSEAHRMLVLRTPPRIVLDGPEHLDSAPAVVARLLQTAPELGVVVASRHVLGVAGEQVLELGPLDAASATELVKQSVSACVPGFAQDAEGLAIAAEVARALEGHPLAIVLAAARTRLMTPAELRRRLTLPVDTPGGQPAEPVLEEAIEASYRLLAPDEQQALLALAALDAPAPLEIAEALVAPAERGGALDLLQALRDRSLVMMRRYGTKRSRVFLDGSIRRYARGRPEYGAQSVRAEGRYVRLLLDLRSRSGAVEERADPFASPAIAPVRLLRRVLGEADPQSAADADLGGLVSWLAERAAHRTVVPEEVDLVAEALDRLERRGNRTPRVLVAYGRILDAAGRQDDALAAYRAALRVPRSSDADLAAAHEALGEALRLALRNEEAARELERARAAHDAVGDGAGASRATCRLAAVAQSAGDIERAETWYREAIATARRAGEVEYVAHAEGGLGALALERQAYETAARHYETALALLDSTSGTRLAALHRGYLGIAYFGLGKPELAQDRLDACIEGCRDVGHTLAFAVFRAVRGATLASRDRLADAERELAAAFKAARGDELAQSLVDLWAGHLELARGRAAAAAEDQDAARGAGRDVAARIAAARHRPVTTNARSATPAPLAVRSDDARFAVSLLVSALAAFEERYASTSSAGVPDHTLEVGVDGAWFRLDGGEVVDLGRKRVASRLLSALANHTSAHGRRLTGASLIEQVWPGERVSTRTSGRLYVAVNQLRQLGLQAVLVRDEQGYRLVARVLFRASPGG